jgi:hypothetical protein
VPQITGEDTALVIGRQDRPRRDQLSSTESSIGGHSIRPIDADGYRDRRAVKLIDVAYQEAGEAQEQPSGVGARALETDVPSTWRYAMSLACRHAARAKGRSGTS